MIFLAHIFFHLCSLIYLHFPKMLLSYYLILNRPIYHMIKKNINHKILVILLYIYTYQVMECYKCLCMLPYDKQFNKPLHIINM